MKTAEKKASVQPGGGWGCRGCCCGCNGQSLVLLAGVSVCPLSMAATAISFVPGFSMLRARAQEAQALEFTPSGHVTRAALETGVSLREMLESGWPACETSQDAGGLLQSKWRRVPPKKQNPGDLLSLDSGEENHSVAKQETEAEQLKSLNRGM